jgi:hypothetical protein
MVLRAITDLTHDEQRSHFGNGGGAGYRIELRNEIRRIEHETAYANFLRTLIAKYKEKPVLPIT